jgi:hypothetical protein
MPGGKEKGKALFIIVRKIRRILCPTGVVANKDGNPLPLNDTR